MDVRRLCESLTALSGAEIDRIEQIADTLQYTADLTGADVFIDCLDRTGRTAVVVAEAKPSGELSAYDETVLGKPALPEDEPAVYHAFRSGMVVRDLKAITQEKRTVRQDVAPVKNGAGRVIGVLIREKDVSRTLLREKKFQELAREREGLNDTFLRLAGDGRPAGGGARETHHRVKNNLQMLASLLNIQARRFPDPEVKRAFRENSTRVLSIAAIHDILTYMGEDGAIRLLPLLERIRRNIQFIGGGACKARITVEGDEILLMPDRATSVALVVNELVTNAMEHGFEGRQDGEIRVTVRHGNRYSAITVEDDGAGFDPAASKSVGLEIVSLTVRDKLGGELRIHSGPGGTRAMFDFQEN